MQDVCPFEFNFEPSTFKVGDTVSYRVPALEGFPFVGTVTAVHDDHIQIVDAGEPTKTLIATRESRPVVSNEQALG
jgi:hypothetical protein